MAAPLAFPTIFLLPTHFEPDELPELESQIPTLTYDINEAKVILGKVAKRPRAILELRSRNLLTEEVRDSSPEYMNTVDNPVNSQPPAKRRKLSASTRHSVSFSKNTVSDTDQDTGKEAGSSHFISTKQSFYCGVHEDDTKTVRGQGTTDEDDDSIVKVVRLAWFTNCLAKEQVLPVDEFLVYQGRKKAPRLTQTAPDTGDILRRAREDNRGGQRASQRWFGHNHVTHHARTPHTKRPHLVEESTSEHEQTMRLPPVPDYLHTDYSCQRPTPCNPPNNAFVEQLIKMRTLRTLESDEVGVRAYSTSIAAVAAYPYLLSTASEVARLPGCGPKIVELYKQWKENGYLDDVQEAASNPKMKVLLLFYEIWGVAAKTANDFYNRGWRDLDDIVENGWDKISRVQQVGVKYYEELQEKIPRAEVEAISHIILQHANKIRKGFHMVIVGGYRRGKTSSGDVDVILSHPDPSATHFFINDIVASLEKSKYITHTLTISSKNSERGQTPVAWKGEDRKAGGFDTLDKALVVWQKPDWDKSTASRNPNYHRRVDIIISPWRTAGCAVIGWTGGTTFERDLRRYCKKVKRLKFDSSGVRLRTDGGEWVDLESDADGTPAPDMFTAEKRVFEKLGLDWRPPEERCTR
ncbi:Nucleotidyltransferase [Xylariaceae sp. FL1651]|nr:Nucleotidyltransferase [Xylariaceae sp. FL1651]